MLFVVLVIISATLWAQPQGQRLPIGLWRALCVGKMLLPARQFNCWVASDTWEHQMLWTYGGYSEHYGGLPVSIFQVGGATTGSWWGAWTWTGWPGN